MDQQRFLQQLQIILNREDILLPWIDLCETNHYMLQLPLGI